MQAGPSTAFVGHGGLLHMPRACATHNAHHTREHHKHVMHAPPTGMHDTCTNTMTYMLCAQQRGTRHTCHTQAWHALVYRTHTSGAHHTPCTPHRYPSHVHTCVNTGLCYVHTVIPTQVCTPTFHNTSHTAHLHTQSHTAPPPTPAYICAHKTKSHQIPALDLSSAWLPFPHLRAWDDTVTLA